MSHSQKPPRPESEYFSRVELEKLKHLVESKKHKLKAEELQRLRDLHHGKCSRCGFEMHTVPFKGVAVDKCLHCGGVFLDQGELEKLTGQESHFWEHVLDLFRF